MVKRGASGLSLLLAVNKPVGMSSHDVVNRIRRIYGERRVGHTGTLDPLASGVLVLCVGPATRLDAYLVGHGKRYRMDVVFGSATETDDREGAVIRSHAVPPELGDASFAQQTVAGLVGRGQQVPPIYSAIKVNGRKSYKAARSGDIIDLAPRPFEVYDASFIEVKDVVDVLGNPAVCWTMELSVSSGTYLRSIARDLGRDLGTCAYVGALERTISGSVPLDACAALEELEEMPRAALIDPLQALGVRWAFAGEASDRVRNGSPLPEGVLSLNEAVRGDVYDGTCCVSGVLPSSVPPHEGEVVGIVANNRLIALYEYDGSQHRYRTRCVFSVGVERGTGI